MRGRGERSGGEEAGIFGRRLNEDATCARAPGGPEWKLTGRTAGRECSVSSCVWLAVWLVDRPNGLADWEEGGIPIPMVSRERNAIDVVLTHGDNWKIEIFCRLSRLTEGNFGDATIGCGKGRCLSLQDFGMVAVWRTAAEAKVRRDVRATGHRVG